MKDYINALDKYYFVIEKFPKSSKTPAAFYKAGISLVRLGEKKKAKYFFRTLISKFPKSQYVKKSKEWIKKIK